MDPAPPEDVFRYCLENPDHLSEEQLLDKFPQHRAELLKWLHLDNRLASDLQGHMPAAAQDAILQRLLFAAETKRNLDSPPETRPAEHRPILASTQARVPGASWLRRSSWAFAVFALLIGSIWFLAAQALPDSPVYGVKLATEDLLLNATSDNSNLVRGNFAIANTRLSEMNAMNSAGKLAAAGPSFDNYSRHLKSGIAIWRTLQRGANTDLDKLIYASSVAGQRTFQGFMGAQDSLPTAIQAPIADALTDLGALTSESALQLEAAGIDLDQALREANGELARLLESSAASSPIPASTPIDSPQPTETPAPDVVNKAALDAARAIISRGGSASTPIVAAAETVIAGVPGTPLASAQQTVLAGWPSATPVATSLTAPTPTPLRP